PFDILRGGARRDTIRIEVWFTAELIDPLCEKIKMLLLLSGVLRELLLNRFTGETSRANGMELISQNTHDLGRDGMVEYRYAVLGLSFIVRCDCAIIQMLPGSAPDLLHVAYKSSRPCCLTLSTVVIDNSLHVFRPEFDATCDGEPKQS